MFVTWLSQSIKQNRLESVGKRERAHLLNEPHRALHTLSRPSFQQTSPRFAALSRPSP
jgi:hypothetical protein